VPIHKPHKAQRSGVYCSLNEKYPLGFGMFELENKKHTPRGFTHARDAQLSIFDFYAEHKESRLLESLSDLMDQYPEVLALIEHDFKLKDAKNTGARRLSFESILRCLLLKQTLKVSYTKLEFHLSDSPTYRSFTRLRPGQCPRRSSLQSVIRRIQSETIVNINKS